MPPVVESKETSPGNDDEQKPDVPKSWRIPLLRLKVNDVCSDGSATFFESVNATRVLKDAVIGVLETLYARETQPKNVRSVTLVLRSMGGVAYTVGSEIDDDHKEIHFSTDYISKIASERARDEIIGVIRHEMVHCWQYNAKGTCPGGLIEGIADWVRLRAGFSPPHWHRGGKKWDDGYQNTAYFLEWCEETIGTGFVCRLNAALKDRKYYPGIWKRLSAGKTVRELWRDYKKAYNLDGADDDDSEDLDNDEDGHHHGAHDVDGNGDDDPTDEQRDNHEDETASEDEDVDVVDRDEVNEPLPLPPIGENGDVAKQKEDATSKITEAFYLRHRLQKIFLTKEHIPDENQLIAAHRFFEFLEMHELPQVALERSKLPKVMKMISKLAHPLVTDPPNNFATRARAIVEKWEPNSKKAKPNEGSVLVNENNEKHDQATVVSIPPPPPPLIEIYGTTERSADDDTCGESCISTRRASIGRSETSGSSTSRGAYSSSNGSTKRGRRTSRSKGSSSSSSSTSSWHFSHADRGKKESQIGLIARKRLGTLEFCGSVDGRRFVKEFEALVDRVDAEMSDDDKRLLLTACFKGHRVNQWYEALDVEDSMVYEELKGAIMREFRTMGREKRILEVGKEVNGDGLSA